MSDFTFAPHIPPAQPAEVTLSKAGTVTSGMAILASSRHSPALSRQRPPLTALSTVTHASPSGIRNEPSKLPAARSAGQERNKGDPFLTRLVYKGLGKLTKVPLEKGYSQMDWLRLTRSTPTPARRRDITMAEVKQHNKSDDAWMVFQSRVYDITPYLNFHPGGRDILLKAAGKDGTALFMKYHPWVNIGALMEKCLLGTLEASFPKPLPPPPPSFSAPSSPPVAEQTPPAARQFASQDISLLTPPEPRAHLRAAQASPSPTSWASQPQLEGAGHESQQAPGRSQGSTGVGGDSLGGSQELEHLGDVQKPGAVGEVEGT